MVKKYIMTRSASGGLVSMDVEDYKNLAKSRISTVASSSKILSSNKKPCKGCLKRKG